MRVELNERDEALLAALARFGIARTSALVTLVFADIRRDTAADRLRRLLDAGYLRARFGDRSEENVYRLGPAGRRWAADHDLAETRPPRSEPDHHLAIVRSWVDLSRCCHEIPGVELVRVIAEWELRARPEAVAYPVIPDAMVEISAVIPPTQTTTLRMAVEIDLATERPVVLRRKVSNYRRLLGGEDGLWGWNEFGLVFVVSGWSDSRRESFGELLEKSWPGWWLMWALEDGPTESMVQLLGALGHPLTSSPYGKGIGGPVTVGNPEGSSLGHEVKS